MYWKKDCEVREKQIGRSFNKKRKMVFQNLGDRKKQQKKTKTNQKIWGKKTTRGQIERGLQTKKIMLEENESNISETRAM